MRQRLGLVGFVSVVCLVVLAAAPVQAQEWSAVQKDVWKSVEAYWAFDLTSDVEGFMSYVDPSYMGWSYDSPVPMDKAAMKKFMALDFQLNKTLAYDVKPVAIQVHGNFAFADYYYLTVTKNAEGKTAGAQGALDRHPHEAGRPLGADRRSRRRDQGQVRASDVGIRLEDHWPGVGTATTTPALSVRGLLNGPVPLPPD